MSTSAQDVAAMVLGAGVLSFFAEVGRRLMGRGRARIDAASVIQEAALELIAPLRSELREAKKEAKEMRSGIADLQEDFDNVIRWAHSALTLLEQHGLTIAPIPARIRRVQ